MNLRRTPLLFAALLASGLAQSMPRQCRAEGGGGIAASCPADVDQSGEVAVGDLVAVILCWNTSGAGCPQEGYVADVDGDQTVGVGDLVAVIVAWGGCPNPDADGDGWSPADGDCCDTVQSCALPHLVNPGAFEIVGNGVDDDCNPATSDAVPANPCSVQGDFSVTAEQLAQAMELCQFTSADAPLPARTWGVISAQFRRADGAAPAAPQLSDMQNWQGAVLVNYGTGGVAPVNGPTMTGLSSGRMRDQNDPGYVVPAAGTTFGWAGNPPAAYLAAHGGALPGTVSCNGRCPSSGEANDSVNLRLTIRAPTNAQSFTYRYRFFSAEYGAWLCTQYNDFHLSLLTSKAPGTPVDGNLAIDSDGNPMNVNSSLIQVCVPQGCVACPLGSAPLAGTGMQVNEQGAGTGWLLITAPVVPGETIVLDVMVFDVSDDLFDSLVLLDGFEWNPIP